MSNYPLLTVLMALLVVSNCQAEALAAPTFFAASIVPETLTFARFIPGLQASSPYYRYKAKSTVSIGAD